MKNTVKKSGNIKTLLRSVIAEWFKNSTSHGLPNIFRTNSTLLKIVWTLFFLLSVSCCVYLISKSIQSYSEYNYLINTEIVQEIPATFPAVTICSLQYTNKTSADKYINRLLYINGTIPKIDFTENNTASVFDTVLKQEYFIQSSISSDKNLTAEEKRSFSPELSEMLLSCKFNWLQCTANDFAHFRNEFYGNCYTFNGNVTSDNLKKSSKPGREYGLILEMFLGNPAIQTKYEYEASGIVVVVHNQSNLPLINSDKIIVAAGAETDVKVSRSFVEKLGQPYSNCLKDTTRSSKFNSKYFDYIINKLNLTYKQDFCYSICLQYRVIELCQCTSGFLPNYEDQVQACLTPEQIACNIALIGGFNDNNSSEECISACPMECDYAENIVTTSSAKFPNKYYKNLLWKSSKVNASGISFEDIDSAVLRIFVYYETMKYTNIQELPLTDFNTFLSNLGGTLGLYIGISFLSIIELVELIIMLLKTWIEFKSQQKIKDSSSNDLKIEEFEWTILII